VPHSVSTTDSPRFFQLVLFLAAAAASPQDLSPADAIFLVMNPGLGCGSRLRPPSWRIVCWWVSVTIVVLRYWMISPVNNFVIPRRTRCVISQGKIPWNTPPWLGIEPGPWGGQTASYPTELSWLTEPTFTAVYIVGSHSSSSPPSPSPALESAGYPFPDRGTGRILNLMQA